MAKRRRGTTWRLWAVVTVIGLSGLVIAGRLTQLQIVDHDEYARQARLTHVTEEPVTGRRGAILDRNGYPLAASADSYDVLVERRAWKDGAKAAEAAQAISAVAGGDPQAMVQLVAETDVFEVTLARGLDYDQATEVRRLKARGVRLVRSSHRVYPEGNLAAQLLGFVGRDNSGLTGLEADLEAILGGRKGTVTFERDGMGNQLAFGDRKEVAPEPGSDVVLTIDRYIQRLAEKELDDAVKKHKAKGGTIIVIQPKTGEILAMASRPTFDLTKLDLSDDSKLALYRNRSVTDQYEPGSVFKLITASAALDLGLVSPDTWWYDSGVVNSGGWSIYNWDFSANGSQTVTQILSKSLNTGAAWLAEQVGPERFYEYVYRYGFGKPTGSGLSGEAPGRVRTPDNDPENWRPVDMATNSFGQGISVTPLQMATALATIANDGRAIKPRLVREIVSARSRQATETEPGEQVISADAARTLRQMMGVVVDGIPKTYLDVQGYRVGGKTGTANIATDGGGYKPNAYIASFVGIAPLSDPALAVLVKIDEPTGVPWGTVVAAPAFDRIVEAVLPYLNVAPDQPAIVSDLQ